MKGMVIFMKIMKIKNISAYILIASVLISAIILLYSFSVKPTEIIANADNNSTPSPIIPSYTGEGSYIVKDYQGELALFRNDSSTPYKKLGIKTAWLTQYDQGLMVEGIRASSEEDLRQIIEDITS